MKTNKVVAWILIFAMLCTMNVIPKSVKAAEPVLQYWTENNLVKVLPTSEKTEQSKTELTLDMAKNEYESGQIVLKSDSDFVVQAVTSSAISCDSDFVTQAVTSSAISCDMGEINKVDIQVNFVEYMNLSYNSVSWWTETEYKNYIDSYGNVFPEKLLNDTSMNVSANTAQSIWVTVNTSKDTPAGEYKGSVDITTTMGNITVPITVTVHDATVPDASEGAYKNIIWAGTAGWTGEEGRGSGASVADPVLDFYPGLIKYSDEWWHLMGEFAKQMKADRVTSYWVPTTHLLLDGGSTVAEDGTVTFNWDKFDEVISFFLQNGSFNVLEGSHFLYGGGVAGYNGYAVNCIYRDADGTTKRGNLPFENEYVASYAKQFFTALDQHLKEKGWSNMWMQYLGDEPMNATFNQQWITARETWMRAAAPDMKVHVAVNNMEAVNALEGHVDSWVPILNIQDQNLSYFNDRKQNYNEDVLNYICGGNPCQYYMNRHIDMPYAPMRLLGWYNFKEGLSGTLNWAYNFWWQDNATTENPGDNGIVYPDVYNNSLIGSVRGASMRDGIEEYELFRMLDRMNPDLARSMVKKILPEESANSQYVINPQQIQYVRLCLLKVLAGEEINMEEFPTEHKKGVSYKSSEITLDGALDEDAWFYKYPVKRLIDGDGQTIAADFSTTWDNDNFYIGLEVKDAANNARDLANGSMSFYVSPDNNRSFNYREKDFQIQVSDQGNTILPGAAGVGNNDGIDTTKIIVKSKYEAGHYTMEIAVPWEQIGVIPTADLSMGLDVMVFDHNTPGSIVTWSGDSNNWMSPTNFGELALKDNNATKTMVTAKAAATDSVDMDGLLEESIWDVRQKLEKVISGTKATIDAEYATAWTEDNLYIGIKVEDPLGETRNFKKDSITFYVSPNNYRGTPYSKDDFQIQVFDCGKTIKAGAAGVGRNDSVDCSKVKVATNYTATGYTMEISMPWSEIGLTPKDNCQMGFDLMAFDNRGATDVDLFSYSALRNVPVYSEELSEGEHTVSIKLTGNHNEELSSSAGAGYVSFDGISIRNKNNEIMRMNDTDPMFEYKGFDAKSDAAYYKGDLHSTNVVDSTITFTFTGDNFTIYGGKDDWSGMPRVIVDGESEESNGSIVEWSGGTWINTADFGTLSLGSVVVPDRIGLVMKPVYDTVSDQEININYLGAKAGDKIVLYKGSAKPSTEKLKEETVSTLPAGTVTFHNDLTDGDYYVAIIRDGSTIYTKDFKVAAMNMQASKTEYAYGEDLAFTYKNANTSGKDWVAIYEADYAPGADSTHPAVVWCYVDKENGSVTFAADHFLNSTHPDYNSKGKTCLMPGKYKAYLLKDDGYSYDGEPCFFTVLAPKAATMTLDKKVYSTDFDISINYSNLYHAKDYIGIYQKGATPSKDTPAYVWKYVDGMEGTMHITAQDVKNYTSGPLAGKELPQGEYEAILLENDGYHVLARTAFSVRKPGITLDKSQYTTDFTIKLTYIGSKYNKDWVGIYKKGTIPSGAPEAATFAYKYLSDENGVLTFTQQDVKDYAYSPIKGQPLPEGDYEMVYMENDTYKVLQRIPFTITKAKNLVPAPKDVIYTRTSSVAGYADGIVRITAPDNKAELTGYAVYWGKGSEKLEGYAVLARVSLNGDVTSTELRKNTYIPTEATSILVYGMKGDILSDIPAVYELSQNDKFKNSDLVTSFQIVSDYHVTEYDSMMNHNADASFKDLHENAKGSSALFVVGDVIDVSTDKAYKNFTDLFKKYTLPNAYFSIGNHEFFETVSNPYLPKNNSYTCEQKAQKFLDKMSEIGNAKALYYDTYINDYHFLVMGSEQKELKDDYAFISEEQFKWLEKTLAKNKGENKPTFLFLHQSMRNTVSGSTNGQNWYGLYEEQEARLRNILKDYPQVIMFNGHTHWTLDDLYAMYDGQGKESSVFNTASAGYLWSDAGAMIDGSEGLYVEVYRDKVLVRGRDLKNGLWKPNASYMIALKPDSPVPTPGPTEVHGSTETPGPVITPKPTNVPEQKIVVKKGKASINIEIKDKEKLQIPTKAILELFYNNEVTSVNVNIKLHKNSGKQPDIVLEKEILEASSKCNKNLGLEIKNEQGRLLYRWNISGKDLQNTKEKARDIRCGFIISDAATSSSTKSIIDKDKNNTQGVRIHFYEKGVLPAQAKIKIYVGDQKGIKAGQKVYLFEVNPNVKKLVTIPYGMTYKVDRNGYVTVNIVKGSDYVVLPHMPSRNVIITLMQQISVTKKATVSSGKTTRIKVTLPVTMEKVASLSSKASSSVKGKVVVSYKVSDSSIAKIYKNGKIKAKKPGVVTLFTNVKLYTGVSKTFKTTLIVK